MQTELKRGKCQFQTHVDTNHSVYQYAITLCSQERRKTECMVSVADDIPPCTMCYKHRACWGCQGHAARKGALHVIFNALGFVYVRVGHEHGPPIVLSELIQTDQHLRIGLAPCSMSAAHWCVSPQKRRRSFHLRPTNQAVTKSTGATDCMMINWLSLSSACDDLQDTLRHIFEALITFVLAGMECDCTDHMPAFLACFNLIMLADEDLDVDLLTRKAVTKDCLVTLFVPTSCIGHSAQACIAIPHR